MAMQGRRNEARESEIGLRIVKEIGELKSTRGNWENQWQEIAERVWPMQSRLFMGQKDSGIEGEKRNEYIYDSTPVTSLNRFAAICDSLLTPRNQTWHKLVPSDKTLKRNRNVLLWFEEVNSILFSLRYAPASNFPSQNNMTFKMLGAYGNSALFIDALKGVHGEKGLRYRNTHISEIWFRENHQGAVNAGHREARVFPRQLIQWFGDNCPPEVFDAAKNKPNEKWVLYHSVEPREDYNPHARRVDSKGLPYASYYVLAVGNHVLEEKGYACFPYAISRYEQSPNEVYGRSPAMDVLPSIKTLNEQKKTFLKQGHRAADPVLLAHDDGVLDAFSLRPGALNPGGVSADGRPLVHALPVGNIQINKEMMDEERADIKASMLVDLFQILEETPDMTATEVMERVKEKGILLTPVLGRQESEYLGPMVQRELTILAELGLLPPPPKMLLQAGYQYHLQYDSPLSRSQRAEEVSGAMRTVEWSISVAGATQDPSVLDIYDFDVMGRDIAQSNAVPQRWLKGEDQVAQIRSGRQQQMQQDAAVRAAPGQAALIKAGSVAKEAGALPEQQTAKQ
jgi:hypothetical protein